MLTLEEQEKAARAHRDAARRPDYSGGMTDLGKGPPKSIGAVEVSELVLKKAYDLHAAMETLYVELLGAGVGAIDFRANPETEEAHVSGVIPETKENLNKISGQLDKLRHLISTTSMGIR
jgi:hypothetical protein